MRHAFFFLIVFVLIFTACTSNGGMRERGPKDIENALKIIESRREAEYAVISSQEREIQQLKENMEHVNSDGMRRKIEGDILVKQTTIQRARKNIANQDTVISSLQQKLDSLRAE